MINTNKLKGRLVERGLNQGDVAKCLGIALPTANQKLNGKRAMSLDEAYLLAKLLDIEIIAFPEYFFYHSDCVEQTKSA